MKNNSESYKFFIVHPLDLKTNIFSCWCTASSQMCSEPYTYSKICSVNI
jgi:hypothetical protein